MKNIRFRLRTIVAVVAVCTLGLSTVSSVFALESVDEISVGDRFKVQGEGSAVYYMAEDGYQIFSHASVYHTYFDSFAGLKTLSTGSLSKLNASDMTWVAPRSGSVLLKTSGGPEVYAIVDGMKHHLENPGVAMRLFGSDWGMRIMNVSEEYLFQFEEGNALGEDASLTKGQIVKTADGMFYFYNGNQLVQAKGLTAHLQDQAVMVSDEVLATHKMSRDPMGVDARGILRADITVQELPSEEFTEENVGMEDESGNTDSDNSDTAKQESTNVDGLVFNNANYTGPFPAPEGMVLKGTVGADTFSMPSGDGPYTFRVQTDWERHIACLDSSRVRLDSKGITWENGWMAGHKAGNAEVFSLYPNYDKTPTGNDAGTALYDEGYRIGYDAGWDDRTSVSTEYDCPERAELSKAEILAEYDEDGWGIYENLEDAPGLTIYVPESPYSNLLNARDNQQVEGYSFGFDVTVEDNMLHNAPLNSGTEPVNVKYIDFGVSTPSVEEVAMGPEGIAQALYNTIKQTDENTGLCTVDVPTIATNTFGDNEITTLDFISSCIVGGGSNSEVAWIPRHYAFLPGKSGQWLTMFVYNHQDVSNANNTAIDMSKYVNVDFVTQFFSKIQF